MPQGVYTYPTYKTGTSQDLMSIVTRAAEVELRQTGASLPSKTETQRLWIEAPFVALGRLLACALELLPSELVLRAHGKVFASLASPKSYPFEAENPALARARALAGEVERRTGRRPALLALISHPPVMGDLAHLNFELVRHAMLALRALRGRPCRPRLVVAVDSFALDTVALPTEGTYAGVMGLYHLGLDRLAYGRRPVSRCLLRPTSWDRMPERLLRRLDGGGEVGMVLAGGVPATTRLLYTVREWLGRMRRKSEARRRPMEVLARLRSAPAFARFEAEAPLGAALRRSAWRLMEAWAMESLARAAAPAEALAAPARETVEACLEALGVSAARRQEALAELAEELRRETPYRARFFEILAARVLGQGRPVVLFPIVHRLEPALGIEVRDAWAWEPAEGERLSARFAGAEGRQWRGTPAEFARLFVTENFR